MIALELSVRSYLGRTWIEVLRVDERNHKWLVARRTLPFIESLTPARALHLLRDELPFLEALADSEAFEVN
jgi:hypothetical protein